MGRYRMPWRGSSAASDSAEKCGIRREPGNRRTSARLATSWSRSIPASSSREWVECPIVKISRASPT
jgi:hypothetical protein